MIPRIYDLRLATVDEPPIERRGPPAGAILATMMGLEAHPVPDFDGDNQRGGGDRRGGTDRRGSRDRRDDRRARIERRDGGDRRDETRHTYNPRGNRRGTDRPGESLRRRIVERRGAGDRRD